LWAADKGRRYPLYDIPEKHAKIAEQELFASMKIEDKETLMDFMVIKRKSNPFWGK